MGKNYITVCSISIEVQSDRSTYIPNKMNVYILVEMQVPKTIENILKFCTY